MAKRRDKYEKNTHTLYTLMQINKTNEFITYSWSVWCVFIWRKNALHSQAFKEFVVYTDYGNLFGLALREFNYRFESHIFAVEIAFEMSHIESRKYSMLTLIFFFLFHNCFIFGHGPSAWNSLPIRILHWFFEKEKKNKKISDQC